MADKDQDFEIWAGQDLAVQWHGITGTDTTSANAIEFFAHDHTGSEALKKTQSGGGISTPDSNKIQVDFGPADTENLSSRAYRYQLWLTDSSGNETPVATGEMTLRAGFS